MINLKEIAENIINIAKKHGCTAQVTMKQNDSKHINLRKGEFERLLTSVGISTGIRLFKGDKSIIISFSGENFGHLESKIKCALQNIDYLSGDKYKRLLSPSEFDSPVQDLNLKDDHYNVLDIRYAHDALKQIENRGLSFDKRIIPSGKASFSSSGYTYSIFTSEGLNKSYSKTSYSFSYSAIAEQNGYKEKESWSESRRHFSDLPDLENLGKIGEIAAEKAIKRLGGKPIKSGERKVIFSWDTAADLLSLLGDAIDGEEIVAKKSFLIDKLGEQILPKSITIIDDPLMPKHMGSYPFDGEGKSGMTKAIFEQGKLNTFVHNSYSAGKLNMNLTGNASHQVSSEPHITVGNFYLHGGKGSLQDLLMEMKEGILVEELYISGYHAVTGHFSFGCTGFLVENGVIVQPVKEITIAGNILELFQNIIAIADDNPWRSSVSSPSILVSKLNIAGS